MSTPLDNLSAHIEILRHCKTKMAEYAEMIERSKAAVQEALQDNEIGTIDGQPVIRWSHQKVTRLDQKKLKAEHPEIVAQYMVTSEQRRFEIQ